MIRGLVLGLLHTSLFIFEAKGRDKGLVVELIDQFINEFLAEFKAIIVDPNISNKQAICCYEKAGFKQTNLSGDPNHLIIMLPKR